MDYDEKTALLVVDVQNDFADPGGSLYVEGGEKVVAAVNDEIERARAGGAHIVYTLDWHPHATPHFERDGGVWPVHCVHDSWGAQPHPKLTFIEAPVVRKGSDGKDGYSAFSVRDPRSLETDDTQLERILRELGVEKVAIAGLATDYCVKESALDALKRGFDTTVLSSAIAAVNLEPGDGDRALTEVTKAGAHLE
jgi:nicotinamidase/pyrazinamidase